MSIISCSLECSDCSFSLLISRVLLITQNGVKKIKNREWAMNVLIVGAGGKAVRIAHDLYRLGYDICGFVSEDGRTPVKVDRKSGAGDGGGYSGFDGKGDCG